MKDIAEQEVIDIGDMDVEAFNDFATEQGWSDGMPLYVPTEAKVAKFVETVRGDNRPDPAGAAAPGRADPAEHGGQRGDGRLQAGVLPGRDGGAARRARPRVQSARHAGDDAFLRADGAW